MDKKKDGIVLNRMYVGDYLSSNLGHEVINLFKADNDNHYIYLNSTGNFASIHKDRIGYMLFVKYHQEDIMEVIGMATELEDVAGSDQSLGYDYKILNKNISTAQKGFIENTEGGIKYGGASILDIFNNAEQQSIFITYKAGKVYVPVKGLRIFLRYGDNAQNNLDGNHKYIALKSYNLPKTSLKSYIYPENDEARNADYNNVLTNLINSADLWTTEGIEKVHVETVQTQKPVSIFDICQIQNDENRFSYALAYFMMQGNYRGLWQKFFKEHGIELSSKYIVSREQSAKIEDKDWDHKEKPSGGRIDLLIRDDKNIVVIENKIKSDINTKESDQNDTTQLNRYVNYIEWMMKNSDVTPQPHFIILTPKYNIPEVSEDMKKFYSIITYDDLYKFLQRNISAFEKDRNFVDFYNAMFRHTHENVNDYLYYEMLEKFINRINEANHHDRITLRQYIKGLQYVFDEFDMEDFDGSYFTTEGTLEELFNEDQFDLALEEADWEDHDTNTIVYLGDTDYQYLDEVNDQIIEAILWAITNELYQGSIKSIEIKDGEKVLYTYSNDAPFID